LRASVLPVTEQNLPTAGWYPDPSGSASLRWWNGVSWSDDVHPLPGAPISGPTTPAATYPELFGTGDDGPEPARRPRRGLWLALAMLVVLLAVAVVAVAALLSAVSNRTQLDTGAVEQKIAEKLSAQTGQTTTVSCPDSVEISAGDTFTCDVTTGDGTTGTVEVTQDDDQGNVTFRVVN
jgi:hypothetical protein